MRGRDRSIIERGIDVYPDAQAVLLEAIETCGGALSSTQFDKWFGDSYAELQTNGEVVQRWTPSPPLMWLNAGDDHAIILGDMYSVSSWSRWLHLLQLMVACGRAASAEDQFGEVWYSSVSNGGAQNG